MFHGEELAGAAEARLDFVGDQQDAVVVAELAQAHHEFLRRDVEAAFALHRLDDDGGDARGLHIGLEQPLDGMHRVLHRDALVRDREGHMPDARRHGAELGLVGKHLAGERHAQQGAAMEAAVEGDDIGAAGIGAGELDGVLDRLGTGGDQRRLLLARDGRDGVQLLADFDEGRVGHDHGAGVGEGFQLLIDALHHQRVAVAGVDHGDAAAKVDVAVALDVPDLGVLGARRHDGGAHADAAGHGLGAPFHPLLVHAWGCDRCVHDVLLANDGGLLRLLTGWRQTDSIRR